MEVILIIVVFWVVGKLLKAVFGGFSKSDYRRDQYTYEATAALSRRFFRVRSRNMIRINQKMNVDK